MFRFAATYVGPRSGSSCRISCISGHTLGTLASGAVFHRRRSHCVRLADAVLSADSAVLSLAVRSFVMLAFCWRAAVAEGRSLF